jgi:hypothetical protein
MSKELPFDVFNKIMGYNSHPCADMIKQSMAELFYNEKTSIVEVYSMFNEPLTFYMRTFKVIFKNGRITHTEKDLSLV